MSERWCGAADPYVLEGIASPEACLLSDTPCLEGKFYLVCDPDSPTVVTTCLNWLGELQRIPEVSHPHIKLLMATTYYRLSMFPALLRQSERASAVSGFERYRQNARVLSQEVYNEDLTSLRAYLMALVEQEVMAKEIEMGKIYATYAVLARDDPGKSLAAQLKAVELEPGNGDYPVTLGNFYVEHGETELARQHYEAAIELVPEFRRESLRSQLQRLQN